MITEPTVYTCMRCHSPNIIRNSHNLSSNPQFKCKDYGRSSAIKPKVKYTEQQKEHIISTYYERGSLRALYRLYGVAPATLTRWIKKAQTPLSDSVVAAEADDVLELDEMWTYVRRKVDKCWL